MHTLLALLTLIYCSLVLWLWYHWRNIPVASPDLLHKSAVSLTIVVVVRNEAQNISNLLTDLDQQCWPCGLLWSPEQLEVIVVDDHSEDGTPLLVKQYAATNYSLTLKKLELPNDFVGSHKKLALSQAIALAKGKVILTTDGDCRVMPQWASLMVSHLYAKGAVLVSGPVVFSGERNFFQRLQTVEFASLIGTGAASMEAGHPNMCNGANLAFSKEAFMHVGGYHGSMHIPSGDDEFLLQKLLLRYPQQLAFLKNKQAVVETQAQPDLISFYHQRKRWAGKWKLHKKVNTALLALFIFTFHTSLLVGAWLVIHQKLSWLAFCALLICKASVEYAMLNDVLKNLGKKLRLLNFMTLQLIYSAYAVFFGIVANFGGYQWKARRYTN